MSEDKVERLRERAVAVKAAADEMVLSYGEIITEREALRERVRELEDQRPTFCSHIAVPWNGHHEQSCYTRPPADPARGSAPIGTADCFLHGQYDAVLFDCPHPDHKRNRPR